MFVSMWVYVIRIFMDLFKPFYVIALCIIMSFLLLDTSNIPVFILSTVGLITIMFFLIKVIFINHRVFIKNFNFRYNTPLYQDNTNDHFIVFDKRILGDTFLLQEITVLLNLYSKYLDQVTNSYVTYCSDESIFLEIQANVEALRLRELTSGRR